MSTEAVLGPDDISNLVYQENYVESVYSQDCGTYTTTLSPSYPFLTIESTGATGGPNNHGFLDKMTLVSTDLSDIGQYTVTMTIS